MTSTSKFTVAPGLAAWNGFSVIAEIPTSGEFAKSSISDAAHAPTSLSVACTVYGTVVSKGTGPLVAGLTANVIGRVMHASAASALSAMGCVETKTSSMMPWKYWLWVVPPIRSGANSSRSVPAP